MLTLRLDFLICFNKPLFRAGGTILKVEGLNYILSKEAPPWLGPTEEEKISNFGLLEWLKRTPNSEIFHSKAFRTIEI